MLRSDDDDDDDVQYVHVYVQPQKLSFANFFLCGVTVGTYSLSLIIKPMMMATVTSSSFLLN